MSSFRIHALPDSYLERIRARGIDDFAHPVVASRERAGAPLRCCLREAAAGEAVALIAYQPSTLGGPYAEIGPIFVHANPCAGYPDTGRYPQAFRHRRQVLRVYDAEGSQIYDLNRIVEGHDAEVTITELLARHQVSYLHSRNVLAGCYMFNITR
jgi:hypothetical protein